jgi:plastocyanin
MYTGTQVNITTPRGAKMLPDNQTFQPNVVRVKVGDLVSFVNKDSQVHRIVSPPYQGDINNANNTNTTTTTVATTSVVPSGIIFDSIIEPGDSASVVFSSPGGFHFNDAFNENATGTLIVEEE